MFYYASTVRPAVVQGPSEVQETKTVEVIGVGKDFNAWKYACVCVCLCLTFKLGKGLCFSNEWGKLKIASIDEKRELNGIEK